MEYSDECTTLCKISEGLRLDPYQDPAGFWTIGYGHKLRPSDPHSGITEAQADALLAEDLQTACAAVNRLAHPPQGLWQGAVDALTDFTFNLGSGNLATSHMLRLLNQGFVTMAALELPKWNHAAGKEMPGLTIRRNKEMTMFMNGAPEPAQ